MYKCVTCSSTFSSILQYNKHQLIHKKEPSLKSQCQDSGCLKFFIDYENFRRHVHRMHNKGEFSKKGNRYYCNRDLCFFDCKTVTLFKKHLNLHLSEESAQITCPFANCSHLEAIFYNKNSFTIHCSTYHRNLNDEEEEIEIDIVKTVEEDVCGYLDDNEDLRSRVDDEEEIEDYESDKDEQSSLEDVIVVEDGALSDIQLPVAQTENADSSRILAEMMLLLSSKYFASELILQGTVKGIGFAFERS